MEVSDPGNGIQKQYLVPGTKKHILGLSDDEIKLDIQQQRIKKRQSRLCRLENT